MDQPWTNSRLRFIAAGRMRHSHVHFEGLDVRDAAGEKLGVVDGFIYDAASYRPYYIVVDSGGWFTSRQFLLPIGHAALDDTGRALRSDVGRDAIEKYPTFDPARFGVMTDADVRAFQQRTVEACCPPDAKTDLASDAWGYERWQHYRQPDWWDARFQPSTDPLGVSG